MASQAYIEWLDAGKPYRLCRPALDLQSVLMRHGYVVYNYPDDRHLQAVPPEDHTPFSATGWPVASARWVGHALDVMPTPGMPPLSVLARNLIADKINGVLGATPIKYINWTDENGAVWHDSWEPGHVRTTSTDSGHIHISFRSDADTNGVVSSSGYDPFGGTKMTLTQADVDLILGSDVLPWKDGKQYSVGGALYDTHSEAQAAKEAAQQTLDGLKTIAIQPVITADPATLGAAVGAALVANATFVDAVATSVAAKLGMIPTAQEIGKAVINELRDRL